jgi:metal-responsive CopG/Arc/MetJ family transcriptional regulator
MKIAVTIPDDVLHQAEELARALGISRSELCARALADFIREQRDERITERLNQVYDETDSELDPALKQLQAASLPMEQW